MVNSSGRLVARNAHVKMLSEDFEKHASEIVPREFASINHPVFKLPTIKSRDYPIRVETLLLSI